MNIHTLVARHNPSLQAERWAQQLAPSIYAYLSLATTPSQHPLLHIVPTPHQQEALTKVVATLNRDIAGCNPCRLRELSRSWGLEEYMVGKIAHAHRGELCGLLSRLLFLAPTPACCQRLTRTHTNDPDVAFGLLLLELHTKPSQVGELLKRHPHPLSLADMERVVEVLHLRLAQLTTPHIEGYRGDNVELYLLYIAWAEGVGSPVEQAQRLATSPNRTLRTAALNILLSEAMVAAL